MKFVIIIPTVFVISIGILVATIFLFQSPGLTSGLVFAAVVLVLFVGPLTFAIIFYFNKIKIPAHEISEKKKIEMQRVE